MAARSADPPFFRAFRKVDRAEAPRPPARPSRGTCWRTMAPLTMPDGPFHHRAVCRGHCHGPRHSPLGGPISRALSRGNRSGARIAGHEIDHGTIRRSLVERCRISDPRRTSAAVACRPDLADSRSVGELGALPGRAEEIVALDDHQGKRRTAAGRDSK